MKRFEWEWHCEWYDDIDCIDRDYVDIGKLEKLSDNILSPHNFMQFGLTLHKKDWEDWIEQERAYIDENCEFDLSEMSRDIPKYIMKEFEEHKHKLKPQGKCPW